MSGTSIPIKPRERDAILPALRAGVVPRIGLRHLQVGRLDEGGALASVVERWVSDVDHEVRAGGGSDDDVDRAIEERLKPLQDLVSGHDFARVVARYHQGFRAHDEALMASALRWLRAEYATK